MANTPEILYVTASSRDAKGKRVVVCEDMAQNVIWPLDSVTEADVKLLGIGEEDRELIKAFLGGR